MEDSYTSDFQGILNLYGTALLAQDNRTWRPTDDILRRWATLAINAQKDHRTFEYDFRSFSNKSLKPNPLYLSSLILNELRSFESDINMVGSIAQNRGIAREPTKDGLITNMPLHHCVDQHTYPEILHYLPYWPNQTYSETLKQIWSYVVGVNPRNPKYAEYYPQMENNSFVQMVRIAQKYIWIVKSYPPQSRPVMKEKNYNFTYTLDLSWLAGLIGPIEVKVGRVTAIVVLKVNDIYQLIAVKKPSRGNDVSPMLTDEESYRAIAKTKEILKQGVKLSNVPSTLPQLSNVVVQLIDDNYYLNMNGVTQSWEAVVKLKYTFPIHPSLGEFSQHQALF